MSADWSAVPVPVPYADFGDPQSLNLYSYVRNLPTTRVDADGHDIIYDPNLKNPQTVKDTVQAILADPNTSGNLSGYVGPNAPNLVIRSGDLSGLDEKDAKGQGPSETGPLTDIPGTAGQRAKETPGSETITVPKGAKTLPTGKLNQFEPGKNQDPRLPKPENKGPKEKDSSSS